MENIQFDCGMEEFLVNGGEVLRFNPADPNVYARFLEAGDKIQALETELTEQAKTISEENGGAGVLHLMAKADGKIKEVLGWVFGRHNDFDRILMGINLLAVAENGERVITNFMEALAPILLAGAERCAREKVDSAVQKARLRREGQ